MGIESRDYYRARPPLRKPTDPAPGSVKPEPRPPGHFRYLLYAAVLIPAAIMFLREPSAAREVFRGAYWLAVIAFAGHLAATWLLFDPTRASLARALQAAVFTGVAGMGALFGVQFLASTNGLGFVGRFIAFAYGLTESSPFASSSPLLTFFGYTLGVGLLEESVKALPIVFLLWTDRVHGWRLACLVGLASGIGFGISEGLWYHESVYNQPVLNLDTMQMVPGEPVGIDGYVLRFVSVVGLHAMFSGTGAMILYRRYRDSRGLNLVEVLWALFGVMCLHGLYDSLLSFEHPAAAFITAVVAFLWFAALVEFTRGTEGGEGFRTTVAARLMWSLRSVLKPRRLRVVVPVGAAALLLLWMVTRPTPLPPRSAYNPRDTFVAVLYVHRGWLHQTAGRLVEARADFERALVLDATCNPAACALAQVAGSSGDSAAAMNAYRQILKTHPFLVHYRLTDETGMVDWTSTVLARDPDDTLGLLMRANLQDRAGGHEAALSTLKSALRRAPDEPALHLYLGSLYESFGRLDEARSAYDRVIARGGDLEAAGRLARGHFFAKSGDHKAALDDYTIAIRLSDSFVAYHLSALSRIALGSDPKGAERDLSASMAREPDNWLAPLRLPDDQREATANRLVAANPLDPLALVIRGDTKRLAQRFDAAKADANEALRLDPRSLFARYLSGRVSLEQGSCDEARSILKAIVADHPSFAPGWLNIAVCAHQKHLPHDEAEAAERVARLSPREARAYWLRAAALRDLREHRAAIDCFALAVGLDVLHEPTAREGYIDWRQFIDPETAVRRIPERLDKNPHDALGLLWRGNAYGALGNMDAAALDFSEAARKAPASPLPLLLLARVRQQENPEQALAGFTQAISVGEKWRTLSRDMD